ncbi:hypothetical protein KKF45_05460 [Patescibacteria group bacterium]|nr:hypothetical protein [Patescibacteria group bacterium]
MENLLSELIGLVRESTDKKETRRNELIRILGYVQNLCNLNQVVLFDENIDEGYEYYRFYFNKDDEDVFWKVKKDNYTGNNTDNSKKINVTKRIYCKIVNVLPGILEKEIKKFEDESEAAKKITEMLNVIN